MAERRAGVRLRVPGGSQIALPPVERSGPSVSIRLGQGEELLVRQDYRQSDSHSAQARYRWLLDWRHPFSSLACGLHSLVCLRGEGEMTTVSALRDPLAEVTVLDLPQGASCVIHPRALVAVAKPISERLRITSHWRLLSLHAWLTLQLRFFVFHGPARLVLKGGRGVRVERAERGRVLGQDQLIGFSADLAYSTTRTRPFTSYFMGHDPLLRDLVESGEGVLIVEEAPLSLRRGGGVRHGLEGALDALLKAVGW